MSTEHVAPAMLVLVVGLLVLAALQGLTALWPHFWLTLGVALAATFPRRG